ncbi:10084_t:CDS:1, partial [Funneliformis mosseae]
MEIDIRDIGIREFGIRDVRVREIGCSGCKISGNWMFGKMDISCNSGYWVSG